MIRSITKVESKVVLIDRAEGYGTRPKKGYIPQFYNRFLGYL